MDLAYSAEYEQYRQDLREFLDKNKHRSPGMIATAFTGEERERIAREWQQLLIEHGYAARTIPKEYGGAGQEPDPLKAHIIAEV
ncbi:MAG: acyl-CoA dehydrogenase family protein, partial [Gammaproteobacteria bacterium]|nr:acyl-CoA dehydrogenase family protein [Gammaproteobacteria bacterium]